MDDFNNRLPSAVTEICKITKTDRSSVAAHIFDCREAWALMAKCIQDLVEELSSAECDLLRAASLAKTIANEIEVHMPNHERQLAKILQQCAKEWTRK